MPVTVALLLSQLPLVPVARAQEVPRSQLSEAQKQKTKEHYEKATRLYNVGKYQEAIAEYEAAYLVSADPVMLFNIAQCHRLNNQPDEAVRFYKNYLRNAPGAPNRDDVERKIVEMERLSEERRRANVPTTQPPSPTPVTPAPGPTVPPAGPPPLGTGSPPPGSSPGEPVSGVSQTMPQRRSRVLPYTHVDQRWRAAGHFGGVRRGGRQQGQAGRRSGQVRPGPIFDAGAKKIQDDGKAASGVAVVTGLAGLAAGGVGLYFLLRSPSSSETGAASPARTETATRAPSTSVFPVVGDGTWGAGARFSF